MSKSSTIRGYGKLSKKAKNNRLFAELPQTPIRKRQPVATASENGAATENAEVEKLTQDLSVIQIRGEDDVASPEPAKPTKGADSPRRYRTRHSEAAQLLSATPKLETPQTKEQHDIFSDDKGDLGEHDEEEEGEGEDANDAIDSLEAQGDLQILSWPELCPPGDRIVKIAEASYAEVYRVTNERGTSIIKVIRMDSPIKAQTKAQQKSGLVDEEPHSESDLMGELQISEWLADIPGFVVYKERYIVEGKACRELLETHQAFHRKLKRQDPDRLQFYPSPSRYLDDTRFLVVELGDAGTALEDFQLSSIDQVWDILFHVTIALARAEAQLEFEHRDLHEGNVCIRQIADPMPEDQRDEMSPTTNFGFSGLDITILDYGLSRARAATDDLAAAPSSPSPKSQSLEPESSDTAVAPVAYDLERDLSLFTSEHAPQCRVYRQMRSFLIRGDRTCLPPSEHKTPYPKLLSLSDEHKSEGGDDDDDERLSWSCHEPYTNVLWLAYLYDFMTSHFRGPRRDMTRFKKETAEFWQYLDPEAAGKSGEQDQQPGFGSASDVITFAVESGWVAEEQLMGGRGGGGGVGDSTTVLFGGGGGDKSIFSILGDRSVVGEVVRRSPRRRRRARSGGDDDDDDDE